MGSLSTYKISFICFLDLLAVSLIVPLMSNYLRNDIHLSNFLIGVLSSTFSLLQIVSAPVIGFLSDRLGRKPFLLSCLLICALSYFLLGLFKHVLVIFLVRVVLGVFKHTQVLCKAYMSDICEDPAKAFSQLMTITFLGFFVGPSLGGHIISYENGFFYVCTLTAGIFVLNFVYVSCVVYDVENRPSLAQEDTSGERLRDLAPFSYLSYLKDTFNIEWSHYWCIFLIKFLYALSMSLFYSNYISVLTQNFGLSSQVTGYTVSFQGFVGSVSNMLVNLDTHNSYSSLYYSFLLLSVSVLALYACANVYLLVVLLIPLSIGSSLIRVLCINITMATGKRAHRSGNISGIYNSLTSVAKVISPLLGGLVTDWAQDNYKVTFLVSFVCAASATVFTKLVLLQKAHADRRKEKED